LSPALAAALAVVRPGALPNKRLRTRDLVKTIGRNDRCSKKVIFDGAHSFVLQQSALPLRNSESSVLHAQSDESKPDEESEITYDNEAIVRQAYHAAEGNVMECRDSEICLPPMA